MDKSKDNSTELENRKQVDIFPKNIEPIGFFKDDSSFVFVYKKTEKLVTAVYMVTNFLSDNEPLKWTFRKKVGELLSFVLGFKDTLSSQTDDYIHIIKNNILELVSLLEIASRSGLISVMNASVLKQEFSNLVPAVASASSSREESSHNLLSKGFFDVQAPHISRHTLGSVSRRINDSEKAEYSMSPNPLKKADGELRPQPDTQVVKRSNRQNIILSLLRKKSNLTIKDISEVVKDCSEKTIQRELISFISGGIVKRVGERRWSRYSLV